MTTMTNYAGLFELRLAELLQLFETEHLPQELAEASEPFGVLARTVAQANPCSFETVEALRHLLMAKDAAVRAVVLAKKQSVEIPKPERRVLGRPGSGGGR